MESDGDEREAVSDSVGPSATCAVQNAMTKEATLFATQGGSQPPKPAAGMERDLRPSIATDGTQRADTSRADHGGFNQSTQHSPAGSATIEQPLRSAMAQAEQHSRQPQPLSSAEVSAFEGAEAVESDLLWLDAHPTTALDRLAVELRAYPTGRLATQQDRALMQLLLEQSVEPARIIEAMARLQQVYGRAAAGPRTLGTSQGAVVLVPHSAGQAVPVAVASRS